MKKALKRSLSLLLAITIIMGSAYVGLGEVDWNGLFAVKANAANESKLKFTLNQDGESYSVSGSDYIIGGVVIPSTYNGKPVTSISSGAFYTYGCLSSVTIPNTIKSIGQYAFLACYKLTSITIPDSVTYIGAGAFQECTELKAVYITNLTKWCGISFADCYSNPLNYAKNLYLNSKLVTNLVIPKGLITLGGYIFDGCKSITSVTIPDSLTTVGVDAFSGCTGLESVQITNLTKWCGINFGNTAANPLYNAKNLYLNGKLVTNLVIPKGLTNLGKYTFAGCTSITSVSIPDSVTSVGSSAFGNCTGLESVQITNLTKWCGINFGNTTANPLYNAKNLYLNGKLVVNLNITKGLKSLGNYTFIGCTSIKSVTIPNSITNIGDYAFSSCSNLSSIIIPDSVTSIGEYAFSSCSNLSSITIPNSITSIGKDTFKNCTGLKSVHITDLSKWCNIRFGNAVANPLYNAQNLYLNGKLVTELVIPAGVSKISFAAFYNCSSLSSVKFPNSVKSIGKSAFYCCKNLTSIIIPNSVTSIGGSAFRDCANIEDVYYQGSKEQWKEIFIGSNNSSLTSATIYYNVGKIAVNSKMIAVENGTILFSIYNKDAWAEVDVINLASPDANSNINDATFVYNGTTKTLTENYVYIKKADLSKGVTVTASDFQKYVIPSIVTDTWEPGAPLDFSVYMTKDRKDGKTHISSVFARNCSEDDDKQYIDVTSNNLNLLNGVKTDVVITAVQQDSAVKEYWLSQDEKHKISDTDGIFSAVDLYSKFDENKPVYAYAVLKNGNTTEPVSVSFKKQVTSNASSTVINALENGNLSFFGKDGFKYTLSDEIPIVGGANITAGIPTIPVGFEMQNERVRISIGADIFKNEINGKDDTSYLWQNFKETCRSIDEVVSKTNGDVRKYKNLLLANQFGTVEDTKKNLNLSFLGYIEGYIIDGELVFKEVCGTAALSFFFTYKQQFLVAGIPAIYAYVKAGGELAGSVGGARPVADTNLPVEFDLAFSLTPSVKIGGGVGVKDAISAGVWGKGSMPIGYNLTDTHFTLGLRGELGLEAEFFILKGDVTLLDGSLNLVDYYFNGSKTPLSGQSDALYSGNAVDVFKDGEVSLADRSYLANTSEWLGGQSASPYSLRRTITPESVKISDLQTSVYKNSQTQLVQFGDTMLMAWIEDCADRDDYNRMRLVYSVYDIGTGLWSAPKAVADNGKCDSAPSLATDGENVYIAWQNIDYTVSTADKETVDIIMENAEIRLAKYNPQKNAFENVKTITNNSTYDYAPKATVNNGVAEVYWVNSASADFQKGTLSIKKSDFNGSTTTVLSGLNYVHCVDSNGIDVSYTMDKDGDTSTTTDIKVYTNSNQVSVDYEGVNASCLYSTYAMLDGKKTLFYVDDYNLCYIQNGEEKVVFDSPRSINGNLQVCSDGTKTTAMWLEAGEMGTELYTCTYENGEWSSPVQLTNLSKVLSNVALTYFEGKIYGVFNRTNLEEVTSQVDGSIYYKNGTTDLCQLTTEGFTDISLSLIDIDESLFIPGSDVKFTVLAENNGTEKITNVSFEVTDSNGYCETIEKTVDLASGDAEFIELTYTVPETISQTELSVYAIVNADTDESDNTTSINIGTPDLEIGELKVQFVEGVYIVSGIVTNNNNVAANDVIVNAYLGEAVDENLFVSNIGTIEPHTSSKIEFMIDGALLNFDESSYCDVTINVASSGEERITYNNESVTVISETGIHAHSYSDWVIEKEATCTEDGSKYKECVDCGNKVTETITAKGHIYSEAWTVDKVATCTEDGSKSHHCTGCDDKKDVTVIKASGHKSSDWIIDTQATASAPGSKHKDCTACDEVLETATIPQLKPATPKVATTNEIGGVNVTWNKVAGATKYVVFRRQGGYNTWVNLGTTTSTTLLDKNVKSGVYYVYSVRAYNASGVYSDFVSANTQTRKFMATPKLTTIYNHQNGLAIKWNAVAGVTNGYRVYRRGAGSTYWTYLGTTKNLYFIDNAVKNKSGEYFRYTVIADGDYHSKFDTTGLYLKRLANPTLTSAVSSTSGITVKWGAVKGTTGYYVYRKTANSTWTRVGTVGGTNNTSFLDKTAKKGTTYTYTVKAVYGATTSAYNSGISCYDKY